MLQNLLEDIGSVFNVEIKFGVSDAFSQVLTDMMLWLYKGCEGVSLPRESLLSVCNKGIKALSVNNMLLNLPEVMFNTPDSF